MSIEASSNNRERLDTSHMETQVDSKGPEVLKIKFEAFEDAQKISRNRPKGAPQHVQSTCLRAPAHGPSTLRRAP
ncbi:hypothetical protein L484_021212 [Morus notabilis]|uniref:Uncharacterized protein n=1 Tax=Morus notabilis TaxID=981085 RepID=W9RSW4_9ROSA|nr:hypothetical protein L484_021212 [Morus notabilis]